MFPTRVRFFYLAALALAIGVAALYFAKRPELPADSIARAVATGDSQLLERSLSKAADPDVPSADGETPLLLAMQRGDRPLIARLLDRGASVDVGDRAGVTPMMLAAANDDAALLRTFCERSKKPWAVDYAGRTAAHYAVRGGKREALEVLLPTVPDHEVTDLLTAACERGDAGTIRLLQERAPAVPRWTKDTRRALSVALARHDYDLLRLLLSKVSAAPTVADGTTPLLAHAIAIGDTELFHALLAGGADPNTVLPPPADKAFVSLLSSDNLAAYVKGDDGVTVLMIAAGLGKSEYIRALLDGGADRNRQTSRYKMLALYFAAHTQKAKCMQMLLGRGPTPEQLRVEISLATQRASVIKDGVQILQTSISTGRKGFDTPAGEYVITDKNRDHRSSIYHVQMPYFMRLNCRDFGMHAGVVPRYPASHGCIRLPADVAEKLFTEIPVGTVVTIN